MNCLPVMLVMRETKQSFNDYVSCAQHLEVTDALKKFKKFKKFA